MEQKSNYDAMLLKMEKEFLNYDQSSIVSRLGLKADADYIYVNFAGAPYRINRRTGHAEWSLDGFKTINPGRYNDAMTIYDMLCFSTSPIVLSGKFAPVQGLGGANSLSPGESMFHDSACFFDKHQEGFKSACLSLGGVTSAPGDIAYKIPLFDFLPVILQFWESDEEFGPVLKLMWDTNILRYLHFETTFFAAGHLFSRIRELIVNPIKI
jgi:hypothetical protein